MRQKSSIANFIVATVAAVAALAAFSVRAADVEIKESVAERYTVQKGDTLWGIAGKFLKDPWRWPEIWRMNREQVRNPHLIYPGDVIVLDRVDGQWRLSLERPATRLSPTVRSSSLDAEAIPSIPAGEIEPYLTRPLITGPDGLVGAAEVVASRDARAVRGEGDIVYVVGMNPAGGEQWNIYRRGRTFMSSDGTELLGVEQRYLGTAKVERFAEPSTVRLPNDATQENVSTVRITNAKEEILDGDRLIPAPRGTLMSYMPHGPTRPVQAEVIATDRDAIEAGRGWVVTLDKGVADGLDVGAVLAIYRVIPPMPDPRVVERPLYAPFTYMPDRWIKVPDERIGLLFVFRVFDRVSYALVLNTSDPVVVGNYARNPSSSP
jgi:LysM domain